MLTVPKRVGLSNRKLPALGILLILVALSGCRHGVYDPSKLPPELIAPPTPDTQALNLSRLGQMMVRNQVIYHGDILEIQAVTGAEESSPPTWRVRVGDDGTIDVPLIGGVQVAGLDVLTAEQAIRQASVDRHVFRHPKVAVRIRERRVNRVTVLGAVPDPSVHELPVGNSNLMAALMAAGGLNEDADTVVEIRQPAQVTAAPGQFASLRPQNGEATPGSLEVDLFTAAAQGGNYFLDDGAVVTVRKQSKRVVHIMGLVSKPQQLTLPPNEEIRVLDAVAAAGGPSMTSLVADKVYVIRKVPNKDDTVIIKVSLSKAKKDSTSNVLLASGDVVSIEETPGTFVLGTFQKVVMMAFWGTRVIPGGF